MDEENYERIPLEKLCCHKNWKARTAGYEKAAMLFRAIEHENADEWSKYVNIIKYFCSDNNAPALEKGLEAAFEFLDKSCLAKKTAHAILPLIVEKCMAPQRHRAKELGTKVCFLFVELRKERIVFDELLKGTTVKNPKLSANCIGVIREIIRAFGPQEFETAQILKRVLTLLDDRNQCVRNEAKSLVVELYRWMGPALLPRLQSTLKPVLFNEMSTAFTNVSNSPVKPVRFFRSPSQTSNFNSEIVSQSEPEVEILKNNSVMSSESLPTVDVLSKIPEDFYNGLQQKKWSDRKGSLESFLNILNSAPKIQNGDFSDLVRSLSGIISKDPNIAVVCTALKCVTKLAEGLGNKFTAYTVIVIKVLFNKFKEKKQTVVSAVHDAIDAVSKISHFEHILDVVVENLANKNPNVKYETVLFSSRFFTSITDSFENRKMIKNLLSILATLLSDQDPNVRDITTKTLGVVLKKLGETTFRNLCSSVDDQKLAKVKDLNLRHFTTEDRSEVLNCQKANLQKDFPKQIIHPCPSRTQSTAKRLPKPTLLENSSSKNICKSPKAKNSGSSEVPDEIAKRLTVKNWAERERAITELQKFLLSDESRNVNIKEIAEVIVHLILDSNLKVASAAIMLIEGLAQNRSDIIKNLLHQFLPPLLVSIGHSKSWVSQPAKNCINTLITTFGFDIFVKSRILLDILLTGSQATRIHLWLWLADKLVSVSPDDNLSVGLANFLPTLFTNLTDRNQGLRKAASRTVQGFLKVMGSQPIMSESKIHSKGAHDTVMRILEQDEKNELATREKTGHHIPSSPEKRPNEIQNLKSEAENLEMEKKISPKKGHGSADFVKFKLDQSLIDVVDQAMNTPIIQPKIVNIDLTFIKESTIPLPKIPNLSKTDALLHMPNVNVFISNVTSTNHQVSEAALKKIGAMIASDDCSVLEGSGIDIFFQHLVNKVKIFARSKHSVSNEYITLFSVISTLSHSRMWMERFQECDLLQLLNELIGLLSHQDDEGEFFDRKIVNAIVLGILANAKKTTLLCCIFKLMSDSINELSVFNLLVKCLWKLQRSETFCDQEFDYPAVLRAMGDFLNRFDLNWRDSNDIAVLTVKRILRSILKARRGAVSNNFNSSFSPSSTKQSEIQIYMEKSIDGKAEDGSRLTRTLVVVEYLELSTIFQEIAANPVKGFRLLKIFKLRNRKFDLTALLSEISPILSTYAQFFDGEEQGMVYSHSREQIPEISTAESFLDEAKRLWCRLEVLKQQFMLVSS